jgi:predicted sugar kinase
MVIELTAHELGLVYGAIGLAVSMFKVDIQRLRAEDGDHAGEIAEIERVIACLEVVLKKM